jgi:hypothetical protein
MWCPRLTNLFIFLVLLGVSQGSVAEQKSFYQCARNPQFLRLAGMVPPVAIDTQQSLFPGVVVRELQGQKRTFRHPSWELSGNIGSTVRDELGNIYAIPTPGVSLAENPIEKRNYVYKIDSKSGEMSVLTKLPTSHPASQMNPFGTMGAAYDCSTKTLYVSTVADSDPMVQRGRIYAINVQTREVKTILGGRDALGLDVFDPGDGKRLYFGDARSSSVYSYPLSENSSQRIQNLRREYSLAELENGNSTQAYKIRFVPLEQAGFKMVVTDMEFEFRLVANTARRFRSYEFLKNDSGWSVFKIR